MYVVLTCRRKLSVMFLPCYAGLVLRSAEMSMTMHVCRSGLLAVAYDEGNAGMSAAAVRTC
jgi:hypothetical protein